MFLFIPNFFVFFYFCLQCFTMIISFKTIYIYLLLFSIIFEIKISQSRKCITYAHCNWPNRFIQIVRMHLWPATTTTIQTIRFIYILPVVFRVSLFRHCPALSGRISQWEKCVLRAPRERAPRSVAPMPSHEGAQGAKRSVQIKLCAGCCLNETTHCLSYTALIHRRTCIPSGYVVYGIGAGLGPNGAGLATRILT